MSLFRYFSLSLRPFFDTNPIPKIDRVESKISYYKEESTNATMLIILRSVLGTRYSAISTDQL